MVNVGELATYGGSVHEDLQGSGIPEGGDEGRNVSTAIEVKLREFAEDVMMQECGILKDAVHEGVKCNPASEENRRVAFRKGSVDAGSEKLDGRAERNGKSDNCRHPYGEGGTAKQVMEDVTKIAGLKIVRVLPVGDNIICGEMEIYRQYHPACTVADLGDGEYAWMKD